MAVITEDVKYAPTYDVDTDYARAVERITWATRMLSRRFIFVGETHNSPTDKGRTYLIGQTFKNHADVIIVAERAIFPLSEDFKAVRNARNVIKEADNSSSPFAFIRNVRIVEQMLREVRKDEAPYRDDETGQLIDRRYMCPRPVVILFGQDHEQPIRDELRRQMRLDEKICWWSLPSIQDEFEKLTQRQVLNTTAMKFIGFTSGDSLKMRVLALGHLSSDIDLAVISGTMATRHEAKYAVYVSRNHAPFMNLLATVLDDTRATLPLRAANRQHAIVLPVSPVDYDNLQQEARADAEARG